MKAPRVGAAFGLALALLAGPSLAAAPTPWSRVLEPAAAKDADVLAQVEASIASYEKAKYLFGGAMRAPDHADLDDAWALLSAADAESSPNLRLRYRLAYVLCQRAQLPGVNLIARTLGLEQAVSVMKSIVRSPDAPAPLRLDVYYDLGIAYSLLGDHASEAAVYDRALDLQPVGESRSVLLANRGEALMAAGRLGEAITSYNAALDLVQSGSMMKMIAYGVTTLWGLAVAVDRNGELDRALSYIALARTYDPGDTRLDSSSWFYGVPADEAWYKALGWWSAARRRDAGPVETQAYIQSILSWDAYIRSVPESDPWLPIARARRAACVAELKHIDKQADKALKHYNL